MKKMNLKNCGELNINDVNQKIALNGWVHRLRDIGKISFIDIRDRYGITQLFFDSDNIKLSKKLGREFVINVKGIVKERKNKNKDMPTGDIEILVEEINILNESKIPPFTIEENTDGNEELRMKYRYLDLRRKNMANNLIVRHLLSQEIRKLLCENKFLEIETPYLIKSTPEGAKDFVVPSSVSKGLFYALPQSPQTFKQLLMVAGFDRYFQIVRCFRDEDLRADRQPEFTQVDCEMSFVDQTKVIETFNVVIKHIINKFMGIRLDSIPIMSYDQAIRDYGTDKPDTRFDMRIKDLTPFVDKTKFKPFDNDVILGISVQDEYLFTRKHIDRLTNFVKTPQVGASGLVWIRYTKQGDIKTSIDKFFSKEEINKIIQNVNISRDTITFIMSGKNILTHKHMGILRLEIAKKYNLIDLKSVSALWVVDFPLFERDENTGELNPCHHPFTLPNSEDMDLIDKYPEKVRACSYDIVLNGNEVGSGSIRIHKRKLQEKIFKILGLSQAESIDKFGFILDAFDYGAPPHGGIALGLDRLAAIVSHNNTIRDFIAFPKNNAAKDIMLDTPNRLSDEQLKDLNLKIDE